MDNSNVRSYDRYAGLFNKACSSVLFLILTILMSISSVGSIISLFVNISGGDIMSIIGSTLGATFLTLSTIGLWVLFTNAKKNTINGGNLTLVKLYPKYAQIVKSIAFITIIVVLVILIAGLFMLKAEFNKAVEQGLSIEELKSEIKAEMQNAGITYDDTDYVDELIDVVIDKSDFILGTGLFIIVAVSVVIIVFLILELIRCSLLVKFIKASSTMFKTGHMVAPPSMFFCVLNYIFSIISIIGSFAMGSFDWQLLVNGLCIGLLGVIIHISREELNQVFTVWKMEIGMIFPDASAANNAYTPNMNGYVNPQQYAPQAPVQQPVQQPVQEAPVAETPVEAQPANENKADENNAAQ